MTGSVLSRGARMRRSADEPPDAVTLATVNVDGMARSGGGGFAHPITHHCLGEQLVVWHRSPPRRLPVDATMNDDAVEGLSRRCRPQTSLALRWSTRG